MTRATGPTDTGFPTVRAMSALALVAAAVFVHGLVSKRLSTTVVTAPMIFVAIGLLSGPEAFDLVSIDLGSEEVIVLAEATLSVILFADAVRVDPARVRDSVGIPARMLGIGLPVAIGAGAVLGRVVLDIDWAQAALVASILAATDAALGQAVLTDDAVPSRIRNSLNVESGLNDGLALPAVTLFSALTAAEGRSESTGHWVRFLAEQIGFGVVGGIVVGAGGGWLLVRARQRGWAAGIEGQLAGLALVGMAFVVAHGLDGNAFIAAFVAGAAFRIVGAARAEHLTEYAEDSGHLLASITFVVFGNALLGPVLGDLTVETAVFVVGALTVTRMGSIAMSLVGTGLRAPTVAFLAWFGPRGLASILFSLTVLEETGRDVEDPLFVVVAWTVLASIVLHGATASWAAGRYGTWYATHRSAMRPDEEMTEGPVDGSTPGVRPRGAPRPTNTGDHP